MVEFPGGGLSGELVDGDVATVTEVGGVCGEPMGGLARVADEDDAPDVPSGLSGSLVTVTQSVSDTMLLCSREATGTPGVPLVVSIVVKMIWGIWVTVVVVKVVYVVVWTSLEGGNPGVV